MSCFFPSRDVVTGVNDGVRQGTGRVGVVGSSIVGTRGVTGVGISGVTRSFIFFVLESSLIIGYYYPICPVYTADCLPTFKITG